MAETSLPQPVEGIAPWPGILRNTRRAMRGAADRRSWIGPLLLMLAVPIADWVLQAQTGAPPPKRPPLTGHLVGDIALGWALFGLTTVVFAFGCVRLIGGRATLAEVFIVMLWSAVPSLALHLPLDGLGLALHGSAWWSMTGSLMQTSSLSALPASAIVLKTIDAILPFWGLALSVVGLSEVHRLSAWKILLLIVLPIFVLSVFTAVAATLLVARMAASGG